MLNALSLDALTARMLDLLNHERRYLVDFLQHLAEVERRRLYFEAGYPTLWNYCVGHLRLTPATSRRTTAAEMLVQFPVIAEYIADGRLCLSTLCALKGALTPENHIDVLERASNRTEKEVKVIAVAIKSKPEERESITLVSPKQVPVPASGPDVQMVTLPPPPPRIEPVTPERYSVKLTIDKEVLDLLEQVKAALSHKIPNGRLEDVLAESLRITLETVNKRKHAETKAPRTSGPDVNTSTRHTPNEVKRAVTERDGKKCAYVRPDGKRCGSTHMLEFHHYDPYAYGGAATVDNISLCCRSHNQYQARIDFGPRAGSAGP
jgi:hypothetical protein